MSPANFAPLDNIPDLLLGRRGIAAFVYLDDTWYASVCLVKQDTPMSVEGVGIAKAAAYEDLVRKLKDRGLDDQPAREYCSLYTIYEVNE